MKVIRCLFWNINDKASPFEDVIKDISKEIDILILAEANNLDDSKITRLTGLKVVKSALVHDFGPFTPKFFSSENGFSLSYLHTVPSKRLVVNLLSIDGFEEVLFCGIHFPSKLEYDGVTQDKIASRYVSWISDIEKVRTTLRTIIVGDFNMNPFELGMISPFSFNATLSEEIAKKGSRTFHYGSEYYFYNPMWSFMGDTDCNTGVKKLPGSYFFPFTGDVSITYWNVFENVILRPDVINNIDLQSIKILTSRSGHQFANGAFQIDKDKYSDHLPLIFNLKF